MASFFDELKRRHVFKVVASYAVVAWLIVQVVVAIAEPLGLPKWSETLVIVAAALGFPAAAVLAWVYDLTARGIERTGAAGPDAAGTTPSSRGAIALGVAAGVALIFTTSYVVVDRWRTPTWTLAVLPFENVLSDPEMIYLGDGIRDGLVTRLSRIPQLRIKTRRVPLGPDEDARTLGRLLDVEVIATGRVVQRDDSLEIVAELLDTRDGTVLWSQRYARQGLSLLAIESEIPAEIARQLRLELSGEEEDALTRAPTSNPAAHRLYLQGRYFWNRRTSQGLAAAADYYQRAIALDPDYALAWAGLADAQLMRFAWSIVPVSEVAPLIVTAVERAIELDPTLAEPHATLGYFKTLHEWDWPGAQRSFLRAIELNNNYSTAHHWYAFYLLTMGDSRGAIEEVLLAREAEPESPIINAEVGYFYLFDRQYERALEELQRARVLDATFPSTIFGLMRAYAFLGRQEEARAAARTWLATLGDDPVPTVYGGAVLPLIGLEAEAREIYTRALEDASDTIDTGVLAGVLAILAATLGEHDAAFAHFDRALDERSFVLSWLRDPLLDGIRDDPRFALMFERAGLPP